MFRNLLHINILCLSLLIVGCSASEVPQNESIKPIDVEASNGTTTIDKPDVGAAAPVPLNNKPEPVPNVDTGSSVTPASESDNHPIAPQEPVVESIIQPVVPVETSTPAVTDASENSTDTPTESIENVQTLESEPIVEEIPLVTSEVDPVSSSGNPIVPNTESISPTAESELVSVRKQRESHTGRQSGTRTTAFFPQMIAWCLIFWFFGY